MPDGNVMLAFLAAAAVFAYMPGPAMLYATAQTIARGRRGGLMAALGIHLGGYVHVLGAALGLAAIFRWVPEAYLVVKLLGAAYLIWLGIAMIREPSVMPNAAAAPPAAGRRSFVQSILVEVLNPKTAVFFIAFLPQFADPAAGLPIWLQLVVLGTIVNVMFSSADLVCVVGAGAVTERLRRSARLVRLFRLAGGSVLVVLGGRLALDRSPP